MGKYNEVKEFEVFEYFKGLSGKEVSVTVSKDDTIETYNIKNFDVCLMGEYKEFLCLNDVNSNDILNAFSSIPIAINRIIEIEYMTTDKDKIKISLNDNVKIVVSLNI